MDPLLTYDRWAQAHPDALILVRQDVLLRTYRQSAGALAELIGGETEPDGSLLLPASVLDQLRPLCRRANRILEVVRVGQEP